MNVEMSPTTVINKCDKILAGIDDARKQMFEDHVGLIMKEKVGWPWSRREKTRDEALTEAIGNSSSVHLCENKYTKLTHLKKAAEVAKSQKSKIWLTAEQIGMIY